MQIISVSDLYETVKDLKEEDVGKLKEWLKLQPHLPQIDDVQIARFLHCCYFSNEQTKRCIDAFFTIRTHCPELFSNRTLNNPEIANCVKVVSFSIMPTLTPKNYKVFYTNLLVFDSNLYSPNNVLKVFDAAVTIDFNEKGPAEGYIAIIDFNGGTLGHLMRWPLMTIKKFLYYLQEAMPIRLKEIHFANAVPFMDKVIALIRPFMKKELFDTLHIHQPNSNTLDNFIPKECLPSELGGTCMMSGKEAHEQFVKKIKVYEDLLMKEDQHNLVDETKRPGKPKTAGELFGVEGTFKKLDID